MEALVRLLKTRTEDITFAECPGGLNTPAILEGVYKTTGMKDVALRYGVKICLDMTSERLHCPDGYVSKNVDTLSAIARAKIFFNVAKLKSHALTVMTGCAKNLFGVIPGLMKAEMHARFPDIHTFCRFVCDINRTITPTFNLLDAITVMEGNGPTGGTPKQLGALLGGTNTFAVDAAGAMLLGIDRKEIPLFQAAHDSGLFPFDTPVVVWGDSVEGLVLSDFVLPDTHSFHLFRNMPKVLQKLLRPSPSIHKKNCIGCGECVRDCPQKTISLLCTKQGKKRAKIHYKHCIRCYCCQELCPVQAVKIKRNPVSFL